MSDYLMKLGAIFWDVNTRCWHQAIEPLAQVTAQVQDPVLLLRRPLLIQIHSMLMTQLWVDSNN